MMKFASVIVAAAALFGCFMSLATGGDVFVNISHLGGVLYLLYLIPVLLLILSILSLYKPTIKYMKVWIVSLSVIGLIISVIGINAGKNTVTYFNKQQANSFNNRIDNILHPENKEINSTIPESYTGYGGIMLVAAYLCCVIITLSTKARLITVESCSSAINSGEVSES